MSQKIALVTGANSGTGKATATALARQGIHVVMLCRSKQRGEAALAEVCGETGGRATLLLCDLGSMDEIRRACRAFRQRFDRLDILVNNAGVITLDRRETDDGLELQFGVNHIGHFLLTRELLPLLTATPGARIVVVASGAHKVGRIRFDDLPMKKGYNVVKAYSRAKLCNVLFTRELARRLRAAGDDTTANCLHPGAVGSNMGVDRDTGFGKTVMQLLRPFFLTPEQGAATAVYLATSPEVAGVSGQYFYKCRPRQPGRRARDPALASRLWAVSEQIVTQRRARGPDKAAVSTAATIPAGI